jgi:4'-phosphopantetheinyl transferase
MQPNAIEELWPVPRTLPALAANEVHVWSASLDGSDSELATLRQVLSIDEIARCDRAPLVEVRNHFIAARGLLRHVLASYLGVAPGGLQFVYGKAGKPYLANNPDGLHFNISHSGDLALIAVTSGCEVGIDLERISDLPEADDIAARFFCDEAKAEFRSASAPDRLPVFFRCWTRKEAIAKCTGAGIAEEQPASADGIYVMDIAPAHEYAAALAVASSGGRFRFMSWPQHTEAPAELCAVHSSGVFL